VERRRSLWWRIDLAASRRSSDVTRGLNQESYKRMYYLRPRLLLSVTATMLNPPLISIMATASSINGKRSPAILFIVLGVGSHLSSYIRSHRVPCTKLVSCHLVKHDTKINSVISHGGHKILNYWLQDSVSITKSAPPPL
jgi:hypothetical protein